MCGSVKRGVIQGTLRFLLAPPGQFLQHAHHAKILFASTLVLLELHSAAAAGGFIGRIDDFNDVHGRAIIQLGSAAIQDAVD